MEEIKVGEYVRTKKDGICKLLNIENDYMWCGYVDKPFWLRKDNIVKHSSNPIDLIEVDDYVNGKRVLVVNDIITDNGEKAILVENYDEWTDDGVITNKDIKSVVTHEQFAQIEYKVEE